MSNPLLAFTDLPAFDRITPADVAPAMDVLLERANAALETVTAPDFPARWDAMAQVLDVATEALGRAWGAVSHLNSVADTPELRAAYNEALPRVTDFWTRLGADERLYAKYKAMDPGLLNSEQRQAQGRNLGPAATHQRGGRYPRRACGGVSLAPGIAGRSWGGEYAAIAGTKQRSAESAGLVLKRMIRNRHPQ